MKDHESVCKISIIVPIYNAQEYLDKCISSLVNQSYKNLEIILVDDASTDGSRDICKKYAELDSRIVLIEKENGGVSSARNAGLTAATGQYISFVDADDYLDEQILQRALPEITANNRDLVTWNTNEVLGAKITRAQALYGEVIEKSRLYAALISDVHRGFYAGHYVRAVWGKLFRRELIERHHIRFQEELYIGEDAVFLLEYLKYADSIVLINEYGYFYRILSSSAVRRYKADLLRQSRLQIELLKDLFPENGSPENGRDDKVRFQDNNRKGAEPSDHYKYEGPFYIVENKAICALEWNMFSTIFKNCQNGIRRGELSGPARYADLKAWYEDLKRDRSFRDPDFTPGKLTKLQMKIGTKVPLWIHTAVMGFYMKIKG